MKTKPTTAWVPEPPKRRVGRGGPRLGAAPRRALPLRAASRAPAAGRSLLSPLGLDPGAYKGGVSSAVKAVAAGALPAEEVGPIVLGAVRANRLHVLTHPNSRAIVEARFKNLADDYDFAAKARG